MLLVKTLKYNPLWTGALEYMLLNFYYMSLFSQCLCLPMLKPFFLCVCVCICIHVYMCVQGPAEVRGQAWVLFFRIHPSLFCETVPHLIGNQPHRPGWLRQGTPGICLPLLPSNNTSIRFTAIRLQARATVPWLRC